MKIDLLNLDNVLKAFKIANNAIYFCDSSDYLTALYEVCKVLNPDEDIKKFGTKYLEE